jgi:hypothetical protein
MKKLWVFIISFSLYGCYSDTVCKAMKSPTSPTLIFLYILESFFILGLFLIFKVIENKKLFRLWFKIISILILITAFLIYGILKMPCNLGIR